MTAVINHLDLPLLAIWTGAWVGRAGILAEMCSFPLLAPEILGPERLRSVEEALRRGLTSPFVRRGAVAIWMAVVFPLSWAIGRLAYVAIPIHTAPPWLVILGCPAVLVLIGLCLLLCIAMVENRLGEHKVDSEVLYAEQEQMAQVITAVLNPLEFHRVARPALWVWVFWAVGIPLSVTFFAVFVLVPKGILGLIHLEQRLLAGGVGLRSLVVGTGIALFFGGMVAQFVATF